MRRLILASLAVIALLFSAATQAQFNGCQFGFCGGAGGIGTPSVTVDFTTNSATVNGLSTPVTNLFSITRADAEPTVNSAGVWGSVGSNTLAQTDRGVQVYAGATNLMLQSQAITTTAWTGAGGNGMTNTDNAAVAPDGTTTAADAAANGVNGTHFFQQSVTLTTGTVNTTSVYVKKGTGTARYLQMFWGGGTPDLYIACIDSTTGQTFILTGKGYIRARSETLANGWFRFIVSYKIGGSQTAVGFALVPALNSTRALTSTLTGSVQVWGFQHETGFSATPYIATTTATVSRAADQVTITGALAAAMASSSGTLVVETGSSVEAVATTVVDSNGTTMIGKTGKNAVSTALGAALYSRTASNWEATNNTIALGWDANGGSLQLASGTPGVDTTARTPSGTFYLGSTGGSSSFWNGVIRKITLYPSKVGFGISAVTPFRAFDAMVPYASNPIIPLNSPNAQVAADAPYIKTTQNVGGVNYALSQGNNGPGSKWQNIYVLSTSDFQAFTPLNLAWTATTSAWDDHYLGHPAIIQIGATWYAYYSGMNSAGTTENIGVATSTDFINWTKYAGNPVVTGANVAIPSVIKIGSTYIMYVSNRTSISITYYTSPDGLTWTLGGTALSVQGNSWYGGVTQMNDPYVVLNPQGFYEMTFSACWTNGTWPTPYTIQSIGYATSTDGINWTVLQAPILQGDGIPGSYNQSYPGDSVLFFNNPSVWLYWAGVDGSLIARGALGKIVP